MTGNPEENNRELRHLRAVERAIDELRRGWPVIITREDDPVGLLVLASETARTDRVESMRALAPELALLVTARRAGVLHLHRHDGRAAAIAIDPGDSIDEITGLADAAQDLDHPFREPRAAVPAPAGSEAALQLAKYARLLPSMIAGTVTPPAGISLAAFANARDCLTVPAAAIENYEDAQAETLTLVTEARLPLAACPEARLYAFRPGDGRLEHLALKLGDPKPHDPVLVRLHSECLTGDILGSLRCDCGEQLSEAVKRLAAEGGILLYLRQEGRGIGLLNKLRAYHVQDDGFDTLEANQRLGFEADERLFLPAAKMLEILGFTRIRLLTNNPDKVAGLEALGIDVAERVSHAFPAQSHNEAYLATKAKRSGHYLDIPAPDAEPAQNTAAAGSKKKDR